MCKFSLVLLRTALHLLVLTVFSETFLAYAQPSGGSSYTVRVVAGSDWVGDGGPSRDSLLLQAEGLAADRDGNLYISDAQTHRVRQITPAGTVRTVAGSGRAGYAGDGGLATEARLSSPYGLAVDHFGNLYIADLGNRCVRRVARDGTISTVTGLFLAPRNVAVDAGGNLYVSDFEANRVYRVTPQGVQTAIVAAGLNHPAGLAIDSLGVLYVGDTGNHVVWKLANGVLTTAMVAPMPIGLAFDTAGSLRVTEPGERDVAFGSDGALYLTDGRLVRRVRPGSNVVIAGRGDPARGDFGPAVEARLNNPAGLALDGTGNLYIADRDNHRVRRIDERGVITTFAGSGIAAHSGDGGLAAGASLIRPTALTFDEAGKLYIAEEDGIRVVDTNGRISTAEEMPGPTSQPYFIDAAHRIAHVDAEGAVSFILPPEPILLPTFVIAGAGGVLYVADADRDVVFGLTPTLSEPEPLKVIEVVNSASLLVGPLAPGSLATIRGVSFAQAWLGGEQVVKLASSNDETVIQVPTTVLPGNYELDLDGVRVPVTIAAAAPALFGMVHLDGSRNAVDNAAARGALVMLFGTGQGVADAPVSIYFGGYDAELLYSGAVPGYPGLWQMNIRVPGGFLAPGERPVTVSVGGAVTPSIPAYIK
jgi:uncharacterized protein (TIGR03437 family)